MVFAAPSEVGRRLPAWTGFGCAGRNI